MKKYWLIAVGVVLLVAVVGLSGCYTGRMPLVQLPSEAEISLKMDSQQEGIWVSGTGEVTVTPDIAILSLGVEAQAGTVAEFLGLSAEESAYIEMKLALSEKLRERRQRKKLTQAELAKAIESSQSRVAKMEAGDPTVSIDLLVKSLLALGVSKKELGRTIS